MIAEPCWSEVAVSARVEVNGAEYEINLAIAVVFCASMVVFRPLEGGKKLEKWVASVGFLSHFLVGTVEVASYDDVWGAVGEFHAEFADVFIEESACFSFVRIPGALCVVMIRADQESWGGEWLSSGDHRDIVYL